MYFEITAICATVIFAVLAFFAIRVLLSLEKTIKRADRLMLELDIKTKRFDSTLNTISNIGDICEEKTALAKYHLLNHKEFASHKADTSTNYADDLADLLLAGLKIGTKLITRKK